MCCLRNRRVLKAIRHFTRHPCAVVLRGIFTCRLIANVLMCKLTSPPPAPRPECVIRQRQAAQPELWNRPVYGNCKCRDLSYCAIPPLTRVTRFGRVRAEGGYYLWLLLKCRNASHRIHCFSSFNTQMSRCQVVPGAWTIWCAGLLSKWVHCELRAGKSAKCGQLQVNFSKAYSFLSFASCPYQNKQIILYSSAKYITCTEILMDCY